MREDLQNVLKGIVLYLAGVGILFFLFMFIFKDHYADLTDTNFMLWKETAFWALLIYIFLCLLYFVVWTFYLVGSYQHDMYEGVLFGFLINLLYLIYFIWLFRAIFIRQTLMPF